MTCTPESVSMGGLISPTLSAYVPSCSVSNRPGRYTHLESLLHHTAAKPSEVAALARTRAVTLDRGDLGKLALELVGGESLEAGNVALDRGAGLVGRAGDRGLCVSDDLQSSSGFECGAEWDLSTSLHQAVHKSHPTAKPLTCFHELGRREPVCLLRMWLARTCDSLPAGGAPPSLRYCAPGRARICSDERPEGASHVDSRVSVL